MFFCCLALANTTRQPAQEKLTTKQQPQFAPQGPQQGKRQTDSQTKLQSRMYFLEILQAICEFACVFFGNRDSIFSLRVFSWPNS